MGERMRPTTSEPAQAPGDLIAPCIHVHEDLDPETDPYAFVYGTPTWVLVVACVASFAPIVVTAILLARYSGWLGTVAGGPGQTNGARWYCRLTRSARIRDGAELSPLRPRRQARGCTTCSPSVSAASTRR